MSIEKPVKIELRNKKQDEGKISKGANMEFLVDGERLRGVRSVKIEVDARGLAKATVEIYGYLKANILGQYEPSIFELKDSRDKNNE